MERRNVAVLVLNAVAAPWVAGCSAFPGGLPAVEYQVAEAVKPPEPSMLPVERQKRRRLRRSCIRDRMAERCMEMGELIEEKDTDDAADQRALYYHRRACELRTVRAQASPDGDRVTRACAPAVRVAERLGCESTFRCAVSIGPDVRAP